MRGAFRNKERWKGRRAPTQDPSTNLLLSRRDEHEELNELETSFMQKIREAYDQNKFPFAKIQTRQRVLAHRVFEIVKNGVEHHSEFLAAPQLGRYVCIKRCLVRAGYHRMSKEIGILEVDDVVRAQKAVTEPTAEGDLHRICFHGTVPGDDGSTKLGECWITLKGPSKVYTSIEGVKEAVFLKFLGT